MEAVVGSCYLFKLQKYFSQKFVLWRIWCKKVCAISLKFLVALKTYFRMIHSEKNEKCCSKFVLSSMCWIFHFQGSKYDALLSSFSKKKKSALLACRSSLIGRMAGSRHSMKALEYSEYSWVQICAPGCLLKHTNTWQKLPKGSLYVRIVGVALK